MKYLSVGILLAGFLALSGCGSDSHDARGEPAQAPAPQEKDLFSLWTSLDGEDALFLGSMEFNEWQNIAIIDGPDICACELQFVGNQAIGSYTFRNCTIVEGAVAVCNVLDRTGTYTKTALELTIQPAAGPAQVYE